MSYAYPRTCSLVLPWCTHTRTGLFTTVHHFGAIFRAEHYETVYHGYTTKRRTEWPLISVLTSGVQNYHQTTTRCLSDGSVLTSGCNTTGNHDSANLG
eukprot:184657-Rhodomonas_salina.1